MADETEQTSTRLPGNPMRWCLGVIGLIILLMLVPRSAVLLFGWIGYLSRTLPNINPQWEFVLIGVIAFALFITSIYWTLPKIAPHLFSKSWKQSFSMSLFFVIAFASGTAVIGATHHLIWILGQRPARESELKTDVTWGIPIISSARQQARNTQWKNQLKLVAQDALNMSGTYGHFPPGGTFDEKRRGGLGWQTKVIRMSYHGYDGGWNDDENWQHPDNARLCKCLIPNFIHPSANQASLFDNDGFGLSQISGNAHVFRINQTFTLSDIEDGAANTLLFGEVRERLRPWCDPANVRDPADGINQVPWGFGGMSHQKGAYFALCDGSVKLVSDSIDRTVLKALSTPQGGEDVSF